MSEKMQQPKDDLIGKVLGQYEIIEEVGRGGMATVYRARQLSINRIVAVKVLPRNLLHDPGFLERFEREVELITKLEHPHILPIYDYGTADGMPFIAMRFLGGGSLVELVRRGIKRLEDLERPFTQVAQALDYAHQQGVIHRDIKPGNVMLDENGNAYLSDFGIARVLGSNLTGSAIIGTPAYMSPEQAHGLPLDARSDIYALGIVLFELITGREPFQAETPMALLLKHINEPLPAIDDYRSDVPLMVEKVLAKATAKEPADRYPSAGEFARAFSEALRAARSASGAQADTEDMPTVMKHATPRPSTQMRAGLSSTVAAKPEPTEQVAATQSEAVVAASRRSPLPFILAGVVALIAVAAALVVLPNLNRTPEKVLIAATLPPPTPFQSARLVQEAQYQIAIPGSWTRSFDRSDTARQVQIWQPDDDSAFMSLALVQRDVTTSDKFKTAVENYVQQYYQSQTHLKLVEQVTAPDGSLRYSYRLDGKGGQPVFPVGQVDVFFLPRGPYLAVLETYAADRAGNSLVPTFQQVLDSLRVKTGGAPQ